MSTNYNYAIRKFLSYERSTKVETYTSADQIIYDKEYMLLCFGFYVRDRL